MAPALAHLQIPLRRSDARGKPFHHDLHFRAVPFRLPRQPNASPAEHAVHEG